MRHMHLMNMTGRSAMVQTVPLVPPAPPTLGLPGQRLVFRRWIAATEECTHPRLSQRLGEDYAQALIDGDPEVDMERVGRFVRAADTVWLNPEGEVLHLSPQLIEILVGPDGRELLRRAPEDTQANIDDALPVRFTGWRLSRQEAVRRFAFRRSLQIRHIDGLTYDFLYGIAAELDKANEVVVLGAGQDGRSPLVFSTNGLSFRGFLEGRVDGPRYILLLHLSNLELKHPPERP